jgi:integrase/recombinase XerD
VTALVPLAPATIAVPVQSAEDAAIDAWLRAQPSEHTRRSYRYAMTLWRDWLQQRGRLLADLPGPGYRGPRRVDADEWRDHLLATMRPKSVDTRLIPIRSFYDYLVGEELLAANPIRAARLLNVGAHTPTPALDENELHRLTVAAATLDSGRRMLTLFLAATGCRAKEAIGLQASDLGRTSGVPVATVTRKGGRRDTIPLDPAVHHALLRHIRGKDPDDPAFTHTDGTPFTASAATFTLDLLARRAGLDRKVTPHMLRATVITILLDKGEDVGVVQDIAGHKKTDTTRDYYRGKGKLKRMARAIATIGELVELPEDDDAAEG